MRFPLAILASILAAYGLGFYLSVPANPEVKFWREVVQRRESDIARIRKEKPGTPIIFFTGGSSCAFSIDPKIIEETCDLPAFNLGLPVSAGGGYLLHQALQKANAGDILVVCLEPDLLTVPDDFKAGQFGFSMACSAGQPSAASGGESFGRMLGLREYLNLSRPGPGYLATWLAKATMGKGYRYKPEDIRYHGRLETSVSDPNIARVQAKTVTTITQQARQFLMVFHEAAEKKGVRLLYSMPWMLTAENAAAHNRDANLQILKSINPIFPTIDDGFQGVSTDPACFADSGLHLTTKGSAIRTQGLAHSLKTWLPHR